MISSLSRLFFTFVIAAASFASAEDWPQWRGPTGDNHASPGTTAPVRWTETEGVVWKTALPTGAGHSSPTIVGQRVYLTTGDAEAGTQSLLVLDRGSGELLRNELVHSGGLPAEIHPNNTHASPTVASDGQRVFALFHNDNAAWLTAFTLEGEKLWQQRVGGFDPQRYQFGFGSSPRVVDGLVIVSTEYDGPESGIYAVSAETGDPVWKATRPDSLSYSTPAIATLRGRKQLFLTGNQMAASYEVATGEKIWSVTAPSFATCGTMVWDEKRELVFGSGGYPESFTLAVKLGGLPQVVWQNRVKCYEQSMLWSDGFIYAVADSGVAYCWCGEDGEEMWKERLGGKFSSSPLLVDGKVYVTSEEGVMRVFSASPEQFELISVNQLGDSGFATPTPVDGRLYHRYGKTENGVRQEYLVAIGE